MRRDRWDCLLDLLIRSRGPVAGKARFLKIWQGAGKEIIKQYEDEKKLRETLRVLGMPVNK